MKEPSAGMGFRPWSLALRATLEPWSFRRPARIAPACAGLSRHPAARLAGTRSGSLSCILHSAICVHPCTNRLRRMGPEPHPRHRALKGSWHTKPRRRIPVVAPGSCRASRGDRWTRAPGRCPRGQDVQGRTFGRPPHLNRDVHRSRSAGCTRAIRGCEGSRRPADTGRAWR